MSDVTRSRYRWTGLVAVMAAALALSACDEDSDETGPDPVRAIKHTALDTRAGLQARKIAGVVAADVTSNVAFETGGQVIELLRKAGDEVEAGELLARLDPEPMELALRQAEGELERAIAGADDARKKYEQQKQLMERGFATQTAFDSAEATMKSAEGSVAVARSAVERARRDLARAELKAPFAGVIARRSVEVFEEVTGGQPIFAMQTAGRGKIEASLPETLVNRITLGDSVEVSFPPLGSATVTGTVDEIAPLAGDANAYPIKLALDRAPAGLRPGMSAELTFRFATEATGKAFLVPLAAVQPDVGGTGEARVYIYDPESRTVTGRDVRITNIEGNNLEIVGDLEAGEIIATAGVSFLHDGMRVDLYQPPAGR